jgi:ribosome-binding protein aMBF1 (putative translation factor)
MKGGIFMKEWSSVRENIQSLSKSENDQLDFAVELVSQIIERRLKLGLTQSELAQKTGIKQSAIARLENLGVIPRLDTMFKLIRPLGLKLNLTDM